jgi:hypothetical protein
VNASQRVFLHVALALSAPHWRMNADEFRDPHAVSHMCAASSTPNQHLRCALAGEPNGFACEVTFSLSTDIVPLFRVSHTGCDAVFDSGLYFLCPWAPLPQRKTWTGWWLMSAISFEGATKPHTVWVVPNRSTVLTPPGPAPELSFAQSGQGPCSLRLSSFGTRGTT